MKFTLCVSTWIVKAQHVAKAINVSVETVKRLTEAGLYCPAIQNQKRFRRQPDKNRQLVYRAGQDIRPLRRIH